MTGGRKIEFATVDWEAGAPRSIFFDDIYFSGDGAGETRHVFLDGNDLEARFAGAPRFTVGEVGFGSGLNVLSALSLWRRVRPANARLEILSFEKFPLHPDDFRRAALAWPQFAEDCAAVAGGYPPPIRGFHRLDLGGGANLTLAFGDAGDLLPLAEARVDAWFLDGFAPAKNPDLWTAAIFAEIARLSAPGATAATFTVAGAVRRGLAGAGFTIEKCAGYGRKREMLRAFLRPSPGSAGEEKRKSHSQMSRRAPWHPASQDAPLAPGAHVAIIGGGVAGAATANAAALAGLNATIIDPAGIAQGASGNPAGLLMPRLDIGAGAPSRFFIAAYLHALGTIARLEARGARLFNPCGVLAPALTGEDAQWAEKALAAELLPSNYIEARGSALFFPQAGVVDPPAFCAALAEGAALVRARAVRIETRAESALIRLDDGRALEAGAVVIANGAQALNFVQARTLPLTRIAGQIDRFADAPGLALAHAFGPYAAPAPDGGAVIGATYAALAAGEAPRPSLDATRANIAAVARALPDFAAVLEPLRAAPRASVRCQTPDRLPLVGPAPDFDAYGAQFDDLRFGKAREYAQGRLVPRLYFLTGLGSRGLVTAPLCAAMIVAEMTGAPAPVERPVAEALHPARFFVRDLKRAVARRVK
ncbi:MAG TPA: bifunctional tRNA (5-methylaminomethyl-2-thiouridine)(34)-methyltransferase MnmD/FAD-dependent 5-carboxymethylaminomethyl-2-thiouridine(34) oxidoreductase MnmC [Parvularcula sp.]|nr:bifunctional tRNA (5-methylaminomethyl-2-thiouridine)(34)-methyltransferase MnmD/FAD-dependent 5-carboxymethylaminomethyl-2-thiouridine(34) oxidoreductase MnmC [Parvularcula sp.]